MEPRAPFQLSSPERAGQTLTRINTCPVSMKLRSAVLEPGREERGSS